jgi:long-chain fatty acid transport protein
MNHKIMFKNISKFILLFATSFAFAQTGHLMQGVGAVNMSMGGAATAQPLDISGAMQWNPATLSVFSGSKLKLDIGAFKGTPTLYSSLPEGAMWPEGAFGPGSPASPPVTGETKSELGYNPMPALAFSWGQEDSKSTFGVSVFGVSGFGVDFPQETNSPLNADGSPNPGFNPELNSNPILYPQAANGFGHLKSSYMLMQVGFTWAYEISDKFSIGLQPTLNYEALELWPNPLAQPDFGPDPINQPELAKGYPNSESATAIGFGGQIGVFYDSQNGFKIGASYKTPQYMSEFEFKSKYLDGSDAPEVLFTMNYPAIYSIGIGYSKSIVDFALDYRYVDYNSTEGFEESGWEIATEGPFTGFPTGAVNGFGWESMSVVSAGIQFQITQKFPIRFGYTYSSNPIKDELAMFSTPATAIIANAFQFGFSYAFSDAFVFDAVYHYGISDGKTKGELLNPKPSFLGGPWSPENPLGAIPGSEVAYDMTTHMFMIGLNFNFGNKDSDKDGVKDKEDACPDVPGLWEFNGCPDSDSDGVQDSKDACPDVAGLASMNGCPDSDGDGFTDKEDMCPEVAGLEQFNGCPDTDGDGVMDSKDECPNVAGLIENKGCPLVDTDGDGVADKDDKCPNVKGVAENHGCPMVTVEVQKEITDLARALYFKTGKAAFTDEATIRLESVSKILSEFTASNFIIEGHTDNTGNDAINKKLSQERADAVMNYLISQGFPAGNIKAVGYGSSKPIGDNKTKKGRQENRRVEIFLDK